MDVDKNDVDKVKEKIKREKEYFEREGTCGEEDWTEHTQKYVIQSRHRTS